MSAIIRGDTALLSMGPSLVTDAGGAPCCCEPPPGGCRFYRRWERCNVGDCAMAHTVWTCVDEFDCTLAPGTVSGVAITANRSCYRHDGNRYVVCEPGEPPPPGYVCIPSPPPTVPPDYFVGCQDVSCASSLCAINGCYFPALPCGCHPDVPVLGVFRADDPGLSMRCPVGATGNTSTGQATCARPDRSQILTELPPDATIIPIVYRSCCECCRMGLGTSSGCDWSLVQRTLRTIPHLCGEMDPPQCGPTTDDLGVEECCCSFTQVRVSIAGEQHDFFTRNGPSGCEIDRAHRSWIVHPITLTTQFQTVTTDFHCHSCNPPVHEVRTTQCRVNPFSHRCSILIGVGIQCTPSSPMPNLMGPGGTELTTCREHSINRNGVSSCGGVWVQGHWQATLTPNAPNGCRTCGERVIIGGGFGGRGRQDRLRGDLEGARAAVARLNSGGGCSGCGGGGTGGLTL